LAIIKVATLVGTVTPVSGPPPQSVPHARMPELHGSSREKSMATMLVALQNSTATGANNYCMVVATMEVEVTTEVEVTAVAAGTTTAMVTTTTMEVEVATVADGTTTAMVTATTMEVVVATVADGTTTAMATITITVVTVVGGSQGGDGLPPGDNHPTEAVVDSCLRNSLFQNPSVKKPHISLKLIYNCNNSNFSSLKPILSQSMGNHLREKKFMSTFSAKQKWWRYFWLKFMVLLTNSVDSSTLLVQRIICFSQK